MIKKIYKNISFQLLLHFLTYNFFIICIQKLQKANMSLQIFYLTNSKRYQNIQNIMLISNMLKKFFLMHQKRYKQIGCGKVGKVPISIPIWLFLFLVHFYNFVNEFKMCMKFCIFDTHLWLYKKKYFLLILALYQNFEGNLEI